MRFLSVLALCIAAPSVPALAGETPWQELAPGVSVRLISAGTADATGQGLFALEIDMPENTKTYWRVPGETGLPTELDFSASTGISGHEPRWPMPQRELAEGVMDYVYFGHTILPFEIAVSDPAGQVDVETTLGICSEICVPAQARFVLPVVDAEADTANALRIRQALAEVPIDWDRGPEPAGAVQVSADGANLVVEIDPDVIDTDTLIVAGDLEAPLFGAPQKSPQDNLVLLPIMGKTDNSMLDGMLVELSFMTPMGAYEVSRTIESGAYATVDAAGQ